MSLMVRPAARRGLLVALILGGAGLILAGVFTERAAVACAGLACLLGVNIAIAHASRLRISSSWTDLAEKFDAVRAVSEALEVVRRSQLHMHRKLGLAEQSRLRERQQLEHWHSAAYAELKGIESRLREVVGAVASVEATQGKVLQWQQSVRATLAALQADSHDVGRMVDALGAQLRSSSHELLESHRDVLKGREDDVVWREDMVSTLAVLQSESHDVGRSVDVLASEVRSEGSQAREVLTSVDNRLELLEQAGEYLRKELTSTEGSGLAARIRAIGQETEHLKTFSQLLEDMRSELVARRAAIEHSNTSGHEVNSRLQALASEVRSEGSQARQVLSTVDTRLELLEQAGEYLQKELTSTEGSGIAARIRAIGQETEHLKTFSQLLEDIGSELVARRAAIEQANTSGHEVSSRLQALKEKLEQMESKFAAVPGGVEPLADGHTANSGGAVKDAMTVKADKPGVHLENVLEARRLLGWMKDEIGQDMEAVVQLYQLLRPSEVSMLLGRGAMDPTAMLGVIRQVVERSPDLVVEVGSGASTLWLGYALQRAGKGKVISLEHSPEYYSIVQKQLEAHELLDVVELRYAPLEKYEIGGREYPWYAKPATDFDRDIDMLLVDGPPGPTHPIARYPALPILANRMSPDVLVVLDDMDREEEMSIKKKWKAEFGLVSYRTIGPRTQSLIFGDSSHKRTGR